MVVCEVSNFWASYLLVFKALIAGTKLAETSPATLPTQCNTYYVTTRFGCVAALFYTHGTVGFN